MLDMRRLLASVAVSAVALLAPSAALAAFPPTLAGPLSPSNVRPVHLTWNNVAVLGETVTYRVYRASASCATAVTFTQISLGLDDTFAFDDSPVDGTYCYQVTADDVPTPESLPSNSVEVILDTTAPTIVPVSSGGDGCTVPFTFTATAGDAVAMEVDGVAYTPGSVYTPAGAAYDQVAPVITARDALGNPSPPVAVPGRILDPSGPGPVSLEVTTDPAARRATLGWVPAAFDGAPVAHRVRTKGPQGPSTRNALTPPVDFTNLQVDATYEFTLEAVDACNRLTSSVRLVRLNDSTPPSAPIIARPGFNRVTHAVSLSWVASTDNIQVDHYVVLRDGVPLGATDATVFTDTVAPEHAPLSYVVRAVDTNGNFTDSTAAQIMTPDWTPPSVPLLGEVVIKGSTATLRWPAATDNVGVVGYDVLRDDKQVASMTSPVRMFKDVGVPVGTHTWRVRARDDAGLSTQSAPQTGRVRKTTNKAKVVSFRIAGGRTGAARYALKPRARLLVDLRVVGTVVKPRLRIHVAGGRGRITVWRGTPGSSAPRTRLGSAVVRRGFVTVRLSRTLHSGRIRLVLIPGGRVVITGAGARAPAIKL